MEGTSYGINVANRYDLFSFDDEVDDPFDSISLNNHKIKKNVNYLNNVSENDDKQTFIRTSRKTEQDIKTVQNKVINNENKHPDPHAEGKPFIASNIHRLNDHDERHGIKETQKYNIRTIREDRNKDGYIGKGFDRRQMNKTSNSETHDDKNKNYEVKCEENGLRRAQIGNRRFDIRGKREYDRQSGSNKSSVKPLEKREGSGSHNWGSVKIESKDYINFQENFTHQEIDDDKVHNSEQGKDVSTDSKLSIDEELKEMTLDEWKAQTAASRSKPNYNIRKAGEGEDAKWEKMVALNKKKTYVGAEEENEIQKIGKQKQVLDIEFHFNDGRRGGIMGRSRGRGGKGTRNTGKREIERKDIHEARDVGDIEKRDRRNRPLQHNDANIGISKFTKQYSRFKTTAPKVDDEHDFPSLG